jgi:rhodanese-related sulfurtransferase
VARIERLALDDLPGRAADVQILDVREQSEWDAGHIPGSAFMPWHDIAALPDGLDPERPIAVVCGSGQRAAVAASLVARAGADHVIHVVDGGVPRWGRLGHPLEQ